MCPCGSGLEYEACCARFHRGDLPETAEELMRARYCAFVKGEHAFLWHTLHRDHEDRARSERVFRERVAAHSKRARYRSLEVIDREGPDDVGIWRVLFCVRVSLAGKDASFVELSSFAADDEAALKYICGTTRQARGAPPASIREFESR